MEFCQNASVFTTNGDKVGHLDRVVVDPENKAITHIVVTKGFIFKEDKVIPIGLIADAAGERINLRENAGDIDALPRFEEKQYVRLDDGGQPPVVSQPLAGMPGAVASAPRERYVKRIEHHIPEGTVALKEGAKVVTSDGKEVAHVESVVAQAEAEHASHLILTGGLLSKERKLVPITWFKILGEGEVELTVEPQQVQELGAVES